MFGRNHESEGTQELGLGDGRAMATMKGQGSGASNDAVSAFVGAGVEFKGIINYQGTVRIDGKLDGEIHTTGVLLVGKDASISAKIEAGTIVCQGRIVGDIVAQEKIQLLSPAVLDGSVKTPVLSMEEGVLFNGTCEMGTQEEAKPQRLEKEAKSGKRDDNLKVV